METEERQGEIKVANLKEHLKLLKEEIAQTITNYEENQTLVVQYEKKISDARQVLSDLKSQEVEIKTSCALRLQEIKKQEESLAIQEAESLLRIKKENDKSELREQAVLIREQTADSSEKSLNEKIKGLMESVNRLTSQEVEQIGVVEENKLIIEGQTREIFLNSQIVDSQHILFNEEVARFDFNIKAKNKELDDIQRKIEKLISETQEPKENLRRQEEELNRKRRDLDIYEARIRARWRILFPDRTLNL